MFGNSLEAHHLLWAYVCVWLIQGGYCAWVALQWVRTSNSDAAKPQTRDDY
jgi:hypothetical protein